MHGIVFYELHRFADAQLPVGSWDRVLEAAGLKGSIYTPLQSYPDQQLGRLVVAAAELAAVEPGLLLRQFGGFIAPGLLQMYRQLLQPQWRTLDVIEHTEAVIHAVVRSKNSGALPPVLRVMRVGPGELVLHYVSARRMCSLAMGIAEGLAQHFQERLELQQERCMLRGDAECLLHLTIR
jgi:hypothetical protein